MDFEQSMRALMEQAQQRNEKRSAWLRHLLLLSAGSLTLLVSLKPEASAGRLALYSLRVAWPALGVGILALAVALHAELWAAQALTRKMAQAIAQGSFGAGPTVVQPPAIYHVCEKIAYAALATSVLALVCHGLARTML